MNMNPNKNSNSIEDLSMRKATRVAGLAYLLIISTSLLSMIFGPTKLIVKGDEIATFKNIVANETLFRIGTLYDLLMYSSVVILAVALYTILKTVNKYLSILAMLWRLGEAILGCLSVLCSLIVLILINRGDYSAIFGTEKLHILVGLCLAVSSAAMSIVFVFLCFGTLVFLYLFYKSRYIPRVLASLGILSFLLFLISTLINIIMPNNALMVLALPAILFEIIIGLWLIVKGINVGQRRENT
jgi:hypothetical protein